jgi:hypothetical protein
MDARHTINAYIYMCSSACMERKAYIDKKGEKKQEKCGIGKT